MPATVQSIEYDPNRTCRIALIQYEDGVKSYILAPVGLSVGDTVISSEKAAPKPGNAMKLANVPLGTSIHNIEMTPGTGGKIARSAGQQAILSNREEGGMALVKMPSGEIRKFNQNCYCTIGQVGNRDHMLEVSGKAGRSRWKGIRPTVRGMCMNPVDHPTVVVRVNQSPVVVVNTSSHLGDTPKVRKPVRSIRQVTSLSFLAVRRSNLYGWRWNTRRHIHSQLTHTQ